MRPEYEQRCFHSLPDKNLILKCGSNQCVLKCTDEEKKKFEDYKKSFVEVRLSPKEWAEEYKKRVKSEVKGSWPSENDMAFSKEYFERLALTNNKQYRHKK